ncbi:MAG: hypothetical protein NTX25_22995 [Proteobacteria bacterium]|nr:hypothetical protein [Pseudomonadota bacterium]
MKLKFTVDEQSFQVGAFIALILINLLPSNFELSSFAQKLWQKQSVQWIALEHPPASDPIILIPTEQLVANSPK